MMIIITLTLNEEGQQSSYKVTFFIDKMSIAVVEKCILFGVVMREMYRSPTCACYLWCTLLNTRGFNLKIYITF